MDELSQYLEGKYPENYIAGYQDCNLLLWGKDSIIPKMCTLNIGIEYNPKTGNMENIEVKDLLNAKYKKDLSFNRLLNYGNQIANLSEIPFVVLVYPALRGEYDGKWEATEKIYPRAQICFHWYEINKRIHLVLRGDELKEKIYKTLDVSFVDEGTSKCKNDHLSDYFHFWSRETLSKNITKLDIDGVLINDLGNRGILIEIKRSSKPPIPKWKPQYDKANYMLESNYAQRINSYFWLLHHESKACNDQEIISFYNIERVNEKEPIDFIISSETVLEMNVSGENSLISRIDKFIHT